MRQHSVASLSKKSTKQGNFMLTVKPHFRTCRQSSISGKKYQNFEDDRRLIMLSILIRDCLLTLCVFWYNCDPLFVEALMNFDCLRNLEANRGTF